MSIEKIKKMVEDGFANKRIATLLQLKESEVKDLIQVNGWKVIQEYFTDNKIDYVCELYAQGISAKSLGLKFNIDKRRIQKWVKQRGILRSKADSHRFTEFNQNLFDIIDTQEKAYWLGFFYADAYNSDTVNTFSLSLKDEDYGHLVKLCQFIDLPISKISRYLSWIDDKSYPTCSIRMYSKHICQKMIELGCPRAKSFIIKYPDWLPKELTISFIRGMFDGDGSLARRENNEWKWSLATTKECGESIQQIILDELKLIVNLSYISKTENNTYELESNGNEKVLKLSTWLYKDSIPNIRLDRKYLKYLDLIDQQNNRTFARKEYKVSESEKQIIMQEINGGANITSIAKDHQIHQRTITKIKYDDKFLFDKIAIINDIPITAKYVKTLDYAEREVLVEPLFQYFRNKGWVYPDNLIKNTKSWKKLCDFNPDLSSNELFNNSSLATDICKYFCHSFYDATEENKSTMKEIFNDDEKLKFLIRNRLGFDWWDKEDNDETFNISFKMLIQGMRSSRLVPSISIFKPSIAKYICLKYSEPGDIVGDYSCGFGGRLLGAMSCGRKYIGTDPLTVPELENMAKFFDFKNYKLIQLGSEDYRGDENSVDLYWSSPPYFSQEYYSNDLTQAYSKGEDYFYDIYWAKTLDNVKHMLKPDKWFGLNVKNYPRMLQMAIDKFGEPSELISLRTVRSHLNKTAGTEKKEYVYMFKNNK